MRLVRAVVVDTNDGYKQTVSKEINENLIELQKAGCDIINVEQQGITGRFAYVMIFYNDPNIQVD